MLPVLLAFSSHTSAGSEAQDLLQPAKQAAEVAFLLVQQKESLSSEKPYAE